MSRLCYALLCASLSVAGERAWAQDSDEPRRVLAIADSALAAITRGDWVGLTDLMLEGAVAFPSTTHDGEFRYSVRTRAEQRASKMSGIVERGYRPEVHVQGPIAAAKNRPRHAEGRRG